MTVARGPLHEALAAGWQVVAHLGTQEPQRVEVDHVDVGLRADCEATPIFEAHEPRRVLGLAFHEELEREARSVRAVATPMRQQIGREAGVGDEAHVGPAVAETRDGVGMTEHLEQVIGRSVAIVLGREEQDAAALVLEQDVEGELDRMPALARGARGQRIAGPGLVARRIVEAEERRRILDHAARDDLRAQRGVGEPREPFGAR